MQTTQIKLNILFNVLAIDLVLAQLLYISVYIYINIRN